MDGPQPFWLLNHLAPVIKPTGTRSYEAKRCMKALSIIALAIICISSNLSSAHAECYGEAAAAYGCGVPANPASVRPGRPSASLEVFGSTDEPVLPDTGYHDQNQSSTDVLTPEERHRMMRNIVLGRVSSSASRSAQTRAVNSAAQPLRRSGSLPSNIR